MLASGFTTRRGRRSAYIHYDKISREIKGRKGARLTALVAGGAIPDQFDFDVILEPSGTFVGTLNEDFAIESMVGDIFQLGNNSWRILKIESNTGKVRVADAQGQPPSIPFWFGEAPGRTKEVSYSVSRLRETISQLLEPIDLLTSGDEKITGKIMSKPIDYLVERMGVSNNVAEQITEYILLGKAAFGEVPSQQNIVMERFFDEAGDMHVVIHSPFGSRINKAWGLSLRKRFCKKFNFELQAAATEEAIIMSLGSTHSFPLNDVFHYLNAKTVEGVLIQALLDNPIFEIRWRWNASRALAVLRMRPGKKVPPQIQRMQSEDLIALIFPDQLACLENIAGEREVPEHPLVDETLKDCLHEAMDIRGLEQLLVKIKGREVNLIAKDLKEPSPFAQEILNAKPYAFLDPAGLEERRTRAVSSRRWIDAKEASELGQLDNTAIDSVKAEAWPQASNEDELYDALVLSGYILEEEGLLNHWKELFDSLQEKGKATILCNENGCWWIAADWFPIFRDEIEDKQIDPALEIPESVINALSKLSDPIREIIRGRFEVVGPIVEEDFINSSPFTTSQVQQAIAALEGEGFIMQGQFTPYTSEKEWCERRLLARIHRYTLKKLRKEIEPVTAAQYMNFLFHWQGVITAGDKNGSLSLLKILEQLEGYQAAAAAWESDILPARLHQYEFTWLDQLCLSGKIQWTCTPRLKTSDHSRGPIKSTKLSLIRRNEFAFWNQFFNQSNDEIEFSRNAKTCLEFLQNSGACFFDQIVEGTGLFESQVEDSIKELVGNGIVTSDSYAGLRALLLPAKFKSKKRRLNDSVFSMESAGRWSILKKTEIDRDLLSDENLEKIARQLLKRYGIVFRRLEKIEKLQIPWRAFVRVLRRMEARGTIRGGRFIEGIWGEQFALPDAIPLLRKIRKPAINGKRKPVVINATDPANLTSILTPSLKVSTIQGNRIMFYEGIPIGVKSGDEIIIYGNPTEFSDWELENMLVRKIFPKALQGYLGKVIY